MPLVPDSDTCRDCRYYRLVASNLIALRWLTMILATVLPLIMVLSDICIPAWNLSTEHVALYSVGVLGLVGIAFVGKVASK